MFSFRLHIIYVRHRIPRYFGFKTKYKQSILMMMIVKILNISFFQNRKAEK